MSHPSSPNERMDVQAVVRLVDGRSRTGLPRCPRWRTKQHESIDLAAPDLLSRDRVLKQSKRPKEPTRLSLSSRSVPMGVEVVGIADGKIARIWRYDNPNEI